MQSVSITSDEMRAAVEHRIARGDCANGVTVEEALESAMRFLAEDLPEIIHEYARHGAYMVKYY